MLTDKLKDKQAQASALMKKLDRSMAIESLWPEVFDHGRASTYWFGKAHAQFRRLARDPIHMHHEFVMTNGNGEKRMFKYDDVPEVLGGGLTESVSIK